MSVEIGIFENLNIRDEDLAKNYELTKNNGVQNCRIGK